MNAWIQYLREGVWRVQLRRLTYSRQLGVHLLRVILIAGRGFNDDHCGLRASALTLYTILSIVPVLALAFGVAKGFNLDKLLEREIYKLFQAEAQIETAALANMQLTEAPDSGGIKSKAEDLATTAVLALDTAATSAAIATETTSTLTAAPAPRAVVKEYKSQIAAKLIDFSNKMLERTSGGLIAGIGVLILLFTVMNGLEQIESSFNHIWGIQTSRPLWRKFTDYFFVVFLSLSLFILSSTLTIWIQSEIVNAAEKYTLVAAADKPLLWMLKFTPVLVLLLLFSFIYTFMPNTQVNPHSGLTGGFVAAILYQCVQLAYIKFQVLTASYGAVYGSFAALPLFIAWLQMSWVIVLLGAEITYAHQNAELYDYEPDCRNVSHAFERRVVLRIAQICVDRFGKGQNALSAGEIAHEIEAPVRLVNSLLHEMVQSGILAEINPKKDGPATYQPARAPEVLTLIAVIEAWENNGTGEIPLSSSPEWVIIAEKLKKIQSALADSSDNLPLHEIHRK